MHHYGHGHPPVLASLSVIRTRPEHQPRSLISSLALFTATRTSRRDVSFQLVHARFDPTDSRAEILAGVCKRIPDQAQLLVRQPVLPAYMLQNGAGIRDLPPTDNQLIARALPGTTLLALALTYEQLIAAGEALELEMAGPQSTPLMRSRRAPQEAMAMWSVYTQSFCRRAESRALVAAFQAWRVLERVKPLPF